MQRAWSSGGRQHSEGRLGDRLLEDVARGVDGGLASAPVLVVVCGDSIDSSPSTLPSSVYLATQNLLVAATALGLGSAMTTLALAHADELATLLALPEHVRPMAVVPLGRPARTLARPRRLPSRTRRTGSNGAGLVKRPSQCRRVSTRRCWGPHSKNVGTFS